MPYVSNFTSFLSIKCKFSFFYADETQLEKGEIVQGRSVRHSQLSLLKLVLLSEKKKKDSFQPEMTNLVIYTLSTQTRMQVHNIQEVRTLDNCHGFLTFI